MLPDWEEAQKYLKSLEDAFMAGDRQVAMARPAAIDPPHVDRRLAVQSSHFVIFGKTKDLIFGKTKDLTRTKVKSRLCHLAKISLPQDNIETIRRDLEDCGITRSFIYPDLEALGKELDQFWKKRSSRMLMGSEPRPQRRGGGRK